MHKNQSIQCHSELPAQTGVLNISNYCRWLIGCLHIRSIWANPDFRLIFHTKSGYPDFIQIFFVQVRIGLYILFSSCKWHRQCRPTDENKNCSNVNTITWWCNVFQTSDSLKVNDELVIEELRVRGVTQEVRLRGLNRRTRDRTEVTIRTNIQKHCICRRPESGVMPHGTTQHWTITSHLFRHSVHVDMHWSNCSLHKTD